MNIFPDRPSPDQISQWINEAVASTPVYDLHTHLYPPNFGNFMLWGIEDLLMYHYLVAETIRVSDVSYEQFWAMDQRTAAEHVWKKLFIERSPISESCRGVLTVLQKLGLDLGSRDLKQYREFFRAQSKSDYCDRVLKLANVHTVVMTNDPLDPAERELWMKGVEVDPRFKAVLRIDPMLLGWPNVADTLSGIGYKVGSDLGAKTMGELRRFLNEWCDRMNPIYCACSLPPTWRYPDDSPTTRVLNEAVLPVARERNLPFAMMIGVTRQVNPRLKLAGDSLGKSDISSLERICATNPSNKFMCTMLSRENQHELAVTGRKQRNLMIFGCWWFTNIPYLIDEITRLRMELLGTSFIPQHSDARVMDQIIYKWEHSRRIIAEVLKEKFTDLARTGWVVTAEEVHRTVKDYLSGNFERFLGATM